MRNTRGREPAGEAGAAGAAAAGVPGGDDSDVTPADDERLYGMGGLPGRIHISLSDLGPIFTYIAIIIINNP